MKINEENDVTPEMPDSIQQQRQETLYQNSTLFDSSAEDELNTVLTAMKALPFGDERQKDAFFENVQRLQGYHVIQIFNLGVASLQKYYEKGSLQFLQEVMKLFQICSSFCYAPDVSRRVAFDYYIRALKFCFPSQPKQFLSTTVVSMLLQLVQIMQEGKLATIVCEKTEKGANSKIQIKGTKYYIAELLAIFETRRDREEGCITEIVAQTVRIASKDASISNIEENVEEKLRSMHVVSPVLLTNWIKLLQLENVNNRFASGLAKLDALSCKEIPFLLPYRWTIHTYYRYESVVKKLVRILEEIKSTGSDVVLPPTEERLAILLNHAEYFCHDPKVTVALLKLLADKSVSSEVLVRAVLDQFFFEEKRKFESYQQCFDWIEIKAKAVDLVSKVLSLLPDGEVVNKLLKFWRESFSVDPDYQTLACMLSLFLEGSSNEGSCCLQERAEKTLEFLDCLDRPLLNLITSWYPFLAWFIREFPTSFHDQRRTEGLCFIRSASRAARLLSDQQSIFVTGMEQFFDWASKQNCTEEIKDEIVRLLTVCCNDSGSLVHNWEFSVDVIKQISVCQQLPFSSKKAFLLKLNDLAENFKEEEKSVFQGLIQGVTSSESLEFKTEVLFEVSDVFKCFVDKDRSTEATQILSDVVQLVSFPLYSSTLSGDRIVKVLQKSKESGNSLLIGKRVLELVWRHNRNEGVNEYFDLLYSAFFDVLKGEKDLCEQFYAENTRSYCYSVTSQFVWSFILARLVSTGSFNEGIDSRCCLTVLKAACGFNSPFEVLHLFSHVRSSAEEIVHLFRRESNTNSSLDIENCLLPTFASSLSTIVSSDVLSGQEKLLLVRKVCGIFP